MGLAPQSKLNQLYHRFCGAVHLFSASASVLASSFLFPGLAQDAPVKCMPSRRHASVDKVAVTEIGQKQKKRVVP